MISLTRGGHEERTTLLHEFNFFCKTFIEAGAPMGPPRPHPLKNEAPSQEMTHTKKMQILWTVIKSWEITG